MDGWWGVVLSKARPNLDLVLAVQWNEVCTLNILSLF